MKKLSLATAGNQVILSSALQRLSEASQLLRSAKIPNQDFSLANALIGGAEQAISDLISQNTSSN